MWGVGQVRAFFAAALALVAALLCAVTPASAQCAPDSAVAVSGDIVTCTSNDPDGFAASVGVINLTVNVQPGATVFDNGTDAIFLNDGNTVTNRGTVTATANANGITSGNFSAVTNFGTVAVVNGVAISVQDNGTVINNATITGADTSTGLFGGNNGTITNAATGAITLGNGARGIFVGGGGNLVTNFGVITIGDGAGLSGGIVAINDGNTIINEAGASIAVGQFNAGISTQGHNTTITNRGAITAGDDSFGISAQGDNGTITNTGTITVGNGFTAGLAVNGTSNTINNGGTITVGDGFGTGILVLGDSNTIINSNTINVGATGIGIDATTITPGSINQIINIGTINVGAGGTGILVSNDGSVFNAGTINAAAGAFAIDFCLCSPASSLTLAPTSVINGLVQGANTTFQLGGTGTGTFNLDLIGAGQQYDGFTTFNKVDASTWTLTGTGNQDWNVLGGTLAVNGTITGTLTVNSGTVGGTGILGSTTINGGTLAPGNSIGTITINGNLVLAAAAAYAVEIGGVSADRTLVTGTASLAGTVQASFLAAPLQQRYTILTAAGGVSGVFGSLNVVGMPGVSASLTYDPNNVYLNLTAVLAGYNQNQQNVATSLNTVFNSGGSLSQRFGALFGLSGADLRNALTALSGEIATQSAQAAFNSVDYFLNLMLDPFVSGRSGDVAPVGREGANRYAAEESDALAYAGKRKPRSAGEQEAYAAMARKAIVPQFERRWSVWGAGYGGELKADGNAAVGSRDASTRAYGFAAGADYLLSPHTLVGASVSGGGTSFSLAQGGGSGRSDVFQAGAFIRHNIGQGYIKGALAYGWHDVTTDRTVALAGIDRLQANFNAHTLGGRIEGGYRYVTPWMGVTPYAAAQAVTYFLPGYAEGVEAGLNTFALNYSSRDVTTARTELGVRTDKSFALQSALVTLRGRAAWAHYFDDNRSLTASFQTLPGTSFVVTGAAQARDAALVSASADVKWLNGISIAGVFEGEFSGQTRGYAGKGVVRYQW